ncbi:MAG: hypothetical protein V4642_06335 [Bacteroidota bacterium]
MKKEKIFPAVIVLLSLVIAALFFQKNAIGQETIDENLTLLDEFKRVVPEVQSGRKALSVFQGERVIQSQVRNIRFGSDYFVVQDSILSGRTISIRKMYIKSSEILWLVEDETAISLRLKN